jgi:preprotein translocase subunit SecY
MWLGEKITDKIGNGISLLIMVGILARFPQAFIQIYLELRITTVANVVGYRNYYLALIVACVFC